MTKRELIKALEPFDDDMLITIYKNGTVFSANWYYHLHNKQGVIVIHNFKPELDKIVELK